MINFKKVVAFGLAAVMSLSLFAGCGGNAGSGSTKHHKIGVGLYTDQGRAVEAINAYLNGISSTVDCEFDVFTLSTYDENANIDLVNSKIAAGCEGLILTADMGSTGILESCKEANVYVAGFLCDYNQSFWTAHDEVFGNEYFLGTVCDGDGTPIAYGEAAAEKFVAEGYKNIGVMTFPDWAYPTQQDVANAFIDKVHELDPSVTVYDIEQVQFDGLAEDYFSRYPDVDAIFSMAAAASSVYPAILQNNKTDVKLITTGFEATADVENFGSNGNQVYQGILCSAPEAIAYPLCLLIDKLNGTTYSDLPETERVSSGSYMVLSDDDMAKMQKTLYYTADYKDAAITGEDIVNMCASYNSEATYAKLVEAVQGLTLK